MPAKTPSKSVTSARSAGKKNAPAPASVPVAASARASNRHRPASEKSPVALASETGGTPALPVLVESADRGIRTSVSLYERDLDELEPLRAYLRQQTGLRVIKDSTLVQVACRTCEPSLAHVDALHAVLAVTGRKYRR